MKMYQSVKDQKLAQLVHEEDDKVTLDVEGEDGERVITKSTLHRWWKPIEMADEKPAKSNVAAAPQKTSTQKSAPKKSAKSSKTSNQDFTELHSNMIDFMNKMHAEMGIEVFIAPKTKGFYSLKVNGKMYMALTLSPKTGINLWLRSKAVEGICKYSRMNHMFDARVTITDWGMETYKTLVALHDASLAFTKAKAESKTK